MYVATRCNQLVVWILISLAFAGVILVAGCETTSPEPTPQPTRKSEVQLRPTFTPRPKVTATPVPTVTDTPLPTATATPVPEPTDTPRPTSKPTAKPAPKPTQKPPTPTTPPYEFMPIGGPVGERNASTTTIKGHVYDANDQPLNGVHLWLKHTGADFEAWTVTGFGADPPGYYSWGLKDYSWNADWQLCVVDSNDKYKPISQCVYFHTDFKTEVSVFTTDWKRTR